MIYFDITATLDAICLKALVTALYRINNATITGPRRNDIGTTTEPRLTHTPRI